MKICRKYRKRRGSGEKVKKWEDENAGTFLVLRRKTGKFMYGLKLAGVDMNRKMLAEMAVNDAEGFATLAELAKSKIA